MLKQTFTAMEKNGGFTLFELLLVIALSGPIIYAGLSTHSYLWGKAWQQQLETRETQKFYALGHWLVRDIQHEFRRTDLPWQWREESQCLLFADKGVRLRNRQLQWKPNNGDCLSNGWLGLHDDSGFKIIDFNISELKTGFMRLCISGKIQNKQPVDWCYSFHAQIYSRENSGEFIGAIV